MTRNLPDKFALQVAALRGPPAPALAYCDYTNVLAALEGPVQPAPFYVSPRVGHELQLGRHRHDPDLAAVLAAKRAEILAVPAPVRRRLGPVLRGGLRGQSPINRA